MRMPRAWLRDVATLTALWHSLASESGLEPEPEDGSDFQT